MSEPKNIIVVGAGIFGLSLSLELRRRGHNVTLFDLCDYTQSKYDPYHPVNSQAASVDHNKILRPSYGTKIHYQRLALEARKEWLEMNRDHGRSDLFVDCGMLRVQPSDKLETLEEETLANMERDGIRDAQFVKSNHEDRRRAAALGWENKLLDFKVPSPSQLGGESFEAVLDSLSGFVKCSEACAYVQGKASSLGVKFRFGEREGRCESLFLEDNEAKMPKAVGIKTADGAVHHSDKVVIAAGSFSTQILPDLAYHLESSAGSVAYFKIEQTTEEKHLWDKYSPERFPVLTWRGAPRDAKSGKDTGTIYVLPRTEDGLVKVGYRGLKFTNFVPAPEQVPFTQDGKWSIPLSHAESTTTLPGHSTEAIRRFATIFLPELANRPFYSTRLCWYTDTLDNSFLIDHVPTYADNSVFVCTGGSGHGAKFLPVLGKHAADILEHGAAGATTSFMAPHWRWRDDKPRGNGLEEGPGGPRDLKSV